MQPNFSHTFYFKTSPINKKQKSLNNILSISQENRQNYYLEYLQYYITADSKEASEVNYRYKTIKVDRKYFLEVANITIDDTARRDIFFTILGKRRFGENDRRIDPYFIDKSIDMYKLVDAYKEYKQTQKPNIIYHTRHDSAKNDYRLVPFECKLGNFVFLYQNNVKCHKEFAKLFIVQLSSKQHAHMSALAQNEQKVDYTFSIIGAHYFESQELHSAHYSGQDTIDEIIERAKPYWDILLDIDHESLRRTLAGDLVRVHEAYVDFYNKSHEMLQNPKPHTIELFAISIVKYTSYFRNIEILQDLVAHLTAVSVFAQDGKLGLLLKENSADLHDISLYWLEIFSHWSAMLFSVGVDNATFRRQTIDVINALKHLIDSYFKYHHEYQLCQTKRKEELGTTQEQKEQQILLHEVEDHASAQAFLKETNLEQELIDELGELASEVQYLLPTDAYDANTHKRLVRFFAGYAKMFDMFYEFGDLGYSLNILVSRLNHIDTKAIAHIPPALFMLVEDIVDWYTQVFVDVSAKDIHYMDDSFYANIMQMEIYLEQHSVATPYEAELF